MARRAGYTTLSVNGESYDIVGDVTYNLGKPKREKLVGPNGTQGYKELPQVPFIDGMVRTSSDFSRSDFADIVDATVLLKHADGTSIMVQGADYCAEGDGSTEEGTMQFRFEGDAAEEISA
jgi:hypothetical protein